MSDDEQDICGVETAEGTPCQNPATDGDTCWLNEHGGSSDPSGRNTKLTKQRQEAIAAAIEDGKSMESASRMTGVDPATVYNWLDRGEDEENSVYAEFYERITRAKGIGEDFYYRTVIEMAREEGDHRSGARTHIPSLAVLGESAVLSGAALAGVYVFSVLHLRRQL